jgi:hypothetical protein
MMDLPCIERCPSCPRYAWGFDASVGIIDETGTQPRTRRHGG